MPLCRHVCVALRCSVGGWEAGMGIVLIVSSSSRLQDHSSPLSPPFSGGGPPGSAPGISGRG